MDEPTGDVPGGRATESGIREPRQSGFGERRERGYAGDRGRTDRDQRGFRDDRERGVRGDRDRGRGPGGDRGRGFRDDRAPQGDRDRVSRGPAGGYGRGDDQPDGPGVDRAPAPPADVDPRDLADEVREELRSLGQATADSVARHLIATGDLLDDEPEAALAHARAARQLAPRIAAVREALGLAMYRNGEWQSTITELRTYHRLTGRQTHLAVIADAERALGRPERAIDIYRTAERSKLAADEAVELLIVAAGARGDLGQRDAAVAMLQVRELTAASREPWVVRLRYAYAESLLAAGRRDEAREWFARTADVDEELITDAAERLLELDGVVLDDVDVAFEDDDEDELDDVDVAFEDDDGDELDDGDERGDSRAEFDDEAVLEDDEDDDLLEAEVDEIQAAEIEADEDEDDEAEAEADEDRGSERAARLETERGGDDVGKRGPDGREDDRS